MQSPILKYASIIVIQWLCDDAYSQIILILCLSLDNIILSLEGSSLFIVFSTAPIFIFLNFFQKKSYALGFTEESVIAGL